MFKNLQGLDARNAYLQAVRDVKEEIECPYSKLKFNYGNITFSQFKNRYTTTEGCLCRKFAALSGMYLVGVAKAIYHLAKAILAITAAPLRENKLLHAQIFHVVRDLQESFGYLATLFNDKYGQYHIQESEYHKLCYDHFEREHLMSITSQPCDTRNLFSSEPIARRKEPDFENKLDRWCKAGGVEEIESRNCAKIKILSCFKEESKSLDLSGLKLTSLPREIGQLQNLTSLYLNDNRLTTIPPELGQLQNLTSLYLNSNQLTTIPPDLGQLQNLERLSLERNQLTTIPPELGQFQNLMSLSLYKNQLTTIPPELGQLQNLEKLYLDYNQLTTIPPDLGQLQNLKWLSLGNNQLTTIPPELGQLQNLTSLYLGNNQLTTIPLELGQLQNLDSLSLRDNQNIHGLPIELFSLSRACSIHLEGCIFSPAVLEQIRETTFRAGYQGPRVFYSMGISRGGNTDMKNLDELLSEIYGVDDATVDDEILRTIRTSFPNEILQSWLNRLVDTADYKNTNQELRKALFKSVRKEIDLAIQNETFRVLFLNVIEGAAATCGDRMTLSLLELGIARKLNEFANSVTASFNLKEVYEYLTNTVFGYELLVADAQKKVQALPFVDEIEVYLGYLLALKEKLKLDFDVGHMLYFSCSYLTQEDLDCAEQSIIAKKSDPNQVAEFLIEQELWLKVLQQQKPNEYKEIIDKRYQALDLNEDLVSSQDRYKKDLVNLSKELIVNLQ